MNRVTPPLPSVSRDRTLEFHPCGSIKVMLGLMAAPSGADSLAVTSSVRPGTAMKASSGLDPTGASTTTCRVTPLARLIALPISPHFSFKEGRMPSLAEAESSDSVICRISLPISPLAAERGSPAASGFRSEATAASSIFTLISVNAPLSQGAFFSSSPSREANPGSVSSMPSKKLRSCPSLSLSLSLSFGESTAESTSL